MQTKTLCLLGLGFSALGFSACASDLSAPHEEVGAKRSAIRTNNCTDEQSAAIEQADADAQQALFDARLALSAMGGNGDWSRYEYWFGSHEDSESLALVASNLEKALAAASVVQYECGCNSAPGSGDVAVSATGNPNVPIKLCPDYLNDQQPYREIKVGALIHEWLHVGATLWDLQWVACDFDTYHQQAQQSSARAARDPENHRMFVLDWTPGDPSEALICRD